MNKNRFFTLLESKSGDVRPLITENKLKEENYLRKKQELLDFLFTVDLTTDGNSKKIDINNDGETDSELMTFTTGDVILYLGVCNFSNEDLKYLCFVKTKPDFNVVLKPTFVDNLDDLESKILPYIKKSYEDTKLNYLGVSDPKEYQPSKNEFNDMLNKAIDNEDWLEAKRLQDKYGDLYR
jgi:hypothetical protein